MKNEYYIDGDTGKDSNPGTVDEPMRTIAGVADRIERLNQLKSDLLSLGFATEKGICYEP